MTEQIWALIRSDGTIEWQGHIGPDEPEIEPGPGAVLVALDRFAEPWERVDPITGQASTDVEARLAAIDAAHIADHGPDAIARGRSIKLAEALVVNATGLPIDGILSAEATLRGISIEEMAQRVIDAAAADRAIELGRMAAKAGNSFSGG